ncbi:hypothetical protein LAZ67_2002692 [Cordylochernes scorpioides]|uniref:Ig-like domain-containing protein n=1 Tax=Cordylochernes scorpioides TaxID=51811 RepID=A0ABY6K2F4_9ARAC|nr:hypothetical protein LAZ67_2002692 [Cordylochernes scorpioides]
MRRCLCADATVTVLGVIGAKARLPCNISSYGDDDEVAIILWYKDDAASPIFSVDARHGGLRESRRKSSDSYRHRTQLSVAGNPLVLSLDVISDEDEGDYWCRVDFKKSRTRNNLIYLQLIALKLHLGGKHFANDDEVQAEANHWLRRQDTAWYNSGIKKLLQRYQKCLDRNDPPAKPIITDHTGEILESLIGPYNEGDRLVLICEVEGGI